MHISENMEFAVSALENWHTKDKFLALEKPAGKKSEGGNYSWQ
jgi:hypothetical protein